MRDDSEKQDTSQNRSFISLMNSQKLGMILLLILLCVALYFFAWREMRFFLVPSRSMEPTLNPEDMVITLNQPQYARGDIVVWSEEGEYVVKRLIGLPGDTVSVVDGALFLNGKYASEPYIYEAMDYTIETPISVPQGAFFYLGDNRNISDDSSGDVLDLGMKSLGLPAHHRFADLDAIIGKVVFRYYPYTRFGSVSSYPLRNTGGD
ncbi:MAG: signal peptidase I [Candidatus Hydrogenedentales bacterium]|jgi:signal peptidase I